MTRVALTTGSYSTRSIIASAQRSLNLYAEKNPPDALSPYTHYLTQGLTPVGTAPQVAPVRGLYRSTIGTLFAVIGNGVYAVASGSFACSLLGTIATTTGPVKMGDNGTTMVIVDGTAAGYTVVLVGGAFATISDPAWLGSNFAEYVDTFMVFNSPGTNIFYTTTSGIITPLNALFFAGKTGYADLLAGIAIQQRQIWLIGTLTSEIWFNAGGAAFPFQIMPGPFVEHGTNAPYSIAKQGGSVFWLSQDQAGQAIVVEASGYQTKSISTPAIEAEISTYSVITDAIGFCYEQLGHPFYWLKFPTAGKDWVFDLSTRLWHERCWLDADGNEQGHRANCAAFAYGVNVVGDRLNGQLYTLDPNNYTDFGGPIKRQRGFPHMMNDGKRAFYTQFLADMQCGDATFSGLTVSLDWSDDRGATYGTPLTQSIGDPGDFLVQPQWRRLGMARDRVFRLTWTAPANTALNGAFVEVEPSES